MQRVWVQNCWLQGASRRSFLCISDWDNNHPVNDASCLSHPQAWWVEEVQVWGFDFIMKFDSFYVWVSVLESGSFSVSISTILLWHLFMTEFIICLYLSTASIMNGVFSSVFTVILTISRVCWQCHFFSNLCQLHQFMLVLCCQVNVNASKMFDLNQMTKKFQVWTYLKHPISTHVNFRVFCWWETTGVRWPSNTNVR